MNLRKNARLTPQGRLLMVCRIEEPGWKVTDAASAAGLSVRRTYHWGPDCGVVGEAVAVRSNAEHEQPENGDKTKRPYD
jgi:leucine-zipper of insertion element IS481